MKEVKYIERELYLNKLRMYVMNGVIKVLTGLRRSGKSYVILNLIDEIRKNDKKANIIFINKEHYEFDHITNYHHLQKYFDEHYREKKNNYFLIDEVQEIEHFEKCLRNVLSKKMADIYVTGSNSEMLSGEISGMLSGRYIEIRIHPLSYPEYLSFFDLSDSNETFQKYITYGGMPGLINIAKNEQAFFDYLKGIYSTVLLKDVVARYNIRNVFFLENLARFLSRNIGSVVSAKNISDYLKSQQIKISPNITLDYIYYLCSAFLINKVKRIDIIGKKIFEVNDKFYFEDIGLRNVIASYQPGDIAVILENVVYNHLRIAGYEVNVGYKGGKEIDFVAKRNGETIYIQVCYLLSDNNVINREFGNLLEIPDNYRKYVISMDGLNAPNTYKGIEHLNIREFCIKSLKNMIL